PLSAFSWWAASRDELGTHHGQLIEILHMNNGIRGQLARRFDFRFGEQFSGKGRIRFRINGLFAAENTFPKQPIQNKSLLVIRLPTKIAIAHRISESLIIHTTVPRYDVGSQWFDLDSNLGNAVIEYYIKKLGFSWR